MQKQTSKDSELSAQLWENPSEMEAGGAILDPGCALASPSSCPTMAAHEW